MERVECVFCKTRSSDENLGEFYKLIEYSFHSNCLIYSWDIRQNSDKSKGLYGFESTNIRLAINRAKRRICSFCSKRGASLKCSGIRKKCDDRFHLPCALESKQTLHVHFDKFESYCNKHIPDQYQCLFDAAPLTGINVVVGCCQKIFSHEECIIKLVNEAKSTAKCPWCRNVKNFRAYVETDLEYKIPNGKPEYAQRQNIEYNLQCAAKICTCPYPDGRFYHNVKTEYELIQCMYCGSDAIHRICGQIKKNKGWICRTCGDGSFDLTLEPIRTKRKRTTSGDGSFDLTLEPIRTKRKRTTND